MSRICMNYAQNFILHGRRGAWSVRTKNLTNLNKPNFSRVGHRVRVRVRLRVGLRAALRVDL